MNVLSTSVKSNVHYVINKKNEGGYRYEWSENESEFDKDLFEFELIDAFEEVAKQLTPYLANINITPTVLNGEESDMIGETAVMVLDNFELDDSYNYGTILATETGFEWRKKGFAPIQFKTADSILEFISILSDNPALIVLMQHEISVPIGVYEKSFLQLSKAGFATLSKFENEIFYIKLGSVVE